MWEDLIQKAKDGGLDVIDTYVFWNVHEPSAGNVIIWILAFLSFSFLHYKNLFFFFHFSGYFQYNFEGRNDLVRFIKTIQKVGLYAHLRIGPYVCAEWNFGYLLFKYIFYVYYCLDLCIVW